MTINQHTDPRQESVLRSGARQLLGNRFGLLAIAVVVLGLGAYSSWGWLVAMGVAPLLLAVAPCAAMCALGMCTMGMKSKTGAPTEKIPAPDGKSGDHKDCC